MAGWQSEADGGTYSRQALCREKIDKHGEQRGLEIGAAFFWFLFRK